MNNIKQSNNFFFLTLTLLLINFNIYSQSSFIYTSSPDLGKQDWTLDATWSRDYPSLSWPPKTPGHPNTHSNLSEVRVNGYVYISSEGLNVSSASPLITVYDTLFINGNVTLASSASMSVETGGILIIKGNLTVEGSFDMANAGKVVVTGDLNILNGSLYNNEKIYVFGDTFVTGGGAINGCDGYSTTCDYNSTLSTENELLAEDGDLYNFVSSDGTLPIMLKSFLASIKFDDVKLDWVTAKEENFSHFEVERTVDNVSYEPIAFVQGNGESLSDVKYEFIDNNAPFGVIYYRLKSVDNDGSFEYSRILSVKKSLEGKVNISPNPANASENIKVNLPGQFEGKIAVVGIYDLNGTMVQQLLDVDALEPLKINSNIKTGMYLIKIQHNGLEENMRLLIR